MFATRYYCNRYFAPRYFPKVGAEPVISPEIGSSAIGQSAIHADFFPRHGSAVRRSAFGFTLLPQLLLGGRSSWQAST